MRLQTLRGQDRSLRLRGWGKGRKKDPEHSEEGRGKKGAQSCCPRRDGFSWALLPERQVPELHFIQTSACLLALPGHSPQGDRPSGEELV